MTQILDVNMLRSDVEIAQSASGHIPSANRPEFSPIVENVGIVSPSVSINVISQCQHAKTTYVLFTALAPFNQSLGYGQHVTHVTHRLDANGQSAALKLAQRGNAPPMQF